MTLLDNLAELGEIEQFGGAVEGFLGGEIDPDKFTAARLQMGVYGQRQEGVQMIRIKVPGGRLTAGQLRAPPTSRSAIRSILSRTSRTRQDLQLYYVPLADTPAALRDLAGYGLTTREACGNTIRNITACPLAGICPKEHVDVTRHVDGAVRHFLRNPLNQQLPRKFKISFSGCESDCAQGPAARPRGGCGARTVTASASRCSPAAVSDTSRTKRSWSNRSSRSASCSW